MSTLPAAMRETLKETFGIKRLRPGQTQVIECIMSGEDTLALMPTGAGKSLCYQLPGLRRKGVTVVVSPLISLMKDQVDKLTALGIEAAQVNSQLSIAEEREAIDAIAHHANEFVFATPERLTDPEFIALLKKSDVDLFVIDEAHCISQWGHDFRPAFLEIKDALAKLGNPQVLALTATATDEVIADIKQQLGRPQMTVISTGIYRANLHYEVLHVTSDTEKLAHVTRLLRKIDGVGIVYTATVKNADAVTKHLQGEGFDVVPYHGKLNASTRKKNQDRFMAGDVKAVVATNAFGMGIDKPDIRFVVHYNLPGALESYYQESGRAGRDGEPARCILLYDLDDRRTHLFFMAGRYPAAEHVTQVYRALQHLNDDSKETISVAQLESAAPAVAKTKIRLILTMLKEMGIIREMRGTRFRLIRDDVPASELEKMSNVYRDKAENDKHKLEQMMSYAQSAYCRWKMLFDYFDEPAPKARCGNCDRCANMEEISSLESELRAQAEVVTAAPPSNDGFKAGNAVVLPLHGRGVIQDVADDTIVVTFPNGETKKFQKQYATSAS